MSVRSRSLNQDMPQQRSPLGFLRPGQVERAFITLLYLTLLALVVLSVIGTFYGRAGAQAPIAHPLQMVSDLSANPAALGIAVAVQFVLTVVQYGARQMATRNPRWWILYLVALGISVYYNIQAYWTPLLAFLPSYVAGVLIIAGDVLPEFIAVRHE